MKKIVCCAIVKNEEEVLERMIKSVNDIVDGYVIFDTGSTDSTKSIIEKYGTLYECEFTDFVTTKNVVLKTVNDMKEYDYILWMDADEYFEDSAQLYRLKELVNSINDYDYITTIITDISSNNIKTNAYTRKRVFKNRHYDTKNSWKFKGPKVHEFLDIVSENFIIDKSINVLHKHKSNGKNYKERFEFYSEMLHDAIKDNPEDLRALFYMARTNRDMYSITGVRDYIKVAIYHYLLYIKVAIKTTYWKDELWQSMYDLALCYSEDRDFDNALKWLDSSIRIDSRRAESFLEKAKLYFYDIKHKDLSAAKKFANNAYYLKIPKDVNLFLDSRYYNLYPLDMLAMIAWEEHDYANGISYLNEMRNIDGLSDSTYSSIDNNILRFQIMLDKVDQEKTYDINTYFDKIFVINLRYRTDRWEKCIDRLAKTGIVNYERYYGVNGDLLGPLVNTNKRVMRTGGYLGCLLSHLDIIHTAKNNNLKNVLILEDDIKIHKNIKEEFNKIINQVEQHHSDWDVLLLGHATFNGHYDINDKNPKYITDIKKYNSNVVRAHNSWALHAYAISNKFYDVILDNYKYDFNLELDIWMLEYIQKNYDYKSLIVYPQLFIQDVTFSDNFKGVGVDHTNFINTEYSTKEDYI